MSTFRQMLVCGDDRGAGEDIMSCSLRLAAEKIDAPFNNSNYNIANLDGMLAFPPAQEFANFTKSTAGIHLLPVPFKRSQMVFDLH